MIRNNWSQLAYEIIETLTCKVRVLTRQQLIHGWQNVTPEQFEKTVESLRSSGLILVNGYTFPKIPFAGIPVHCWTPGDPHPEVEAIAQTVGQRWKLAPVTQDVFAATKQANRLFGANGVGFPTVHQLNHQLLLSEVYVNYRAMIPAIANSWIGREEVSIIDLLGKKPNAFLMDETGRLIRAVQSAGRFNCKQIESFHACCKASQLAYELW